MFNRQQKTVTTSTVQGFSSSSSSTVTQTFITKSTAYHSESSSNEFQTEEKSESPTIRETIQRLNQLSINQPSNKIIHRKENNSLLKKSDAIPSSTVQPSNKIIHRKENNFPLKKSDAIPSSTVDNNEKFQLDCLNAHNDYRRKHGVAPLKLNPTLSNFAQNWANTIAKKRQLQHSSERKYGENIYWSSGKSINGKVPVDSWYDEIKQYSYKNASFSSGTGHFTQVVWKSSIELGVGMACVENEVYVVASYYPPGNYSGEFSNNVFPPK